MMLHQPTKRLPSVCLLVAVSILNGGCVGGSWLESPLEAELPIGQPSPKAFPTAVAIQPPPKASNADSYVQNAATALAELQTEAPPQVTEEASAVAEADPVASEVQAPPVPVTRIAVVPPHLRAKPQVVEQPTAKPAPAASEAPAQAIAPAAAPAPDTSKPEEPQTLAVLAPAVPATAEPAVITADTGSSAANAQSPDAQPESAPAAKPVEKQSPAESPPAKAELGLHAAREAFIAALEVDIKKLRTESPDDEHLPRLEQQLRLAYLTANRMDDAVSSVESLDEAQREAYKHLMFGLGVWLSPDEARQPALRGAKVLRSVRDATSELSSASKLELRNLVFCERVEYFGWYDEFSRNEFKPKQEVLLYVEVDNFAAEDKGVQGFETELQGSYQIFDGSGQVVAERQLQLDREVCRNYRRDYFLAYRIYMPDAISPGRYRLELTIEDLKAGSKYQGRKLGQGMIEFAIRQ